MEWATPLRHPMDLHFENPIVQAEGWRGQEGLAFLFSSGRTSSPLDFDIEAFFFETFKHAATSLLVSAPTPRTWWR